MPKLIRQTATFKASPHDVFEALMDSRKHAKFTGAPAKISRKIGGEFSVYGGGLSGKTIELVSDKKIVQEWRSDDWPEGHFSHASFSLKQIKGGTQLSFYQSNVPDEHYDGIKQGWIDYYWKPMKAMLDDGK
jgi:activator of HSP90 ATPase